VRDFLLRVGDSTTSSSSLKYIRRNFLSSSGCAEESGGKAARRQATLRKMESREDNFLEVMGYPWRQ
jgi:hypothetical protein